MKSDNNLKRLKNQLAALQKFIFTAGFSHQKRRQYLNRPTRDFTRKRKLGFSITVTLILGLLKKAWTLS